MSLLLFMVQVAMTYLTRFPSGFLPPVICQAPWEDIFLVGFFMGSPPASLTVTAIGPHCCPLDSFISFLLVSAA